MPDIHAKFTKEGEKFGVVFTGRHRGISRILKLYKYDGEQWHHLEEERQEDSFIGYPGEVDECRMRRWGQKKAGWYTSSPNTRATSDDETQTYP